MAGPPPEFKPTRLLRHLFARRVDFIVVGGLAVIAHGYGRTTKDLDIAMKEAAGRPQDLADLQALAVIKRLRRRQP